MGRKAQFFIGITIAAGGGIIASSIAQNQLPFSNAYIGYCLLAWIASALKVRLPGMTGTMSANFLFVLVSIAVFSLAQTVLLATGACIVQCFARARHRPLFVQVAFNVAAWTISSGTAYRISHWLTTDRSEHFILLMPVAAFLFFISNTLLISGVLSLVEHKPLFQTWLHCYLWVFPFYMAGSAIAALVVEAGRSEGWPMSLVALPPLYMMFFFYRYCVSRLAGASAS